MNFAISLPVFTMEAAQSSLQMSSRSRSMMCATHGEYVMLGNLSVQTQGSDIHDKTAATLQEVHWSWHGLSPFLYELTSLLAVCCRV